MAPILLSMPLHHGSETFFIEGEGVVGAQAGGRSGRERDPVNASGDPAAPAPAALAAAEAPPFRFSRCGPKGTPLGPAVTIKLAEAMVAGGGGSGDVPAGYTYLGQFIDHDLTMDRTEVELGDDVTPAQLVQGRSPRLDLDSLYGVGPGDPVSARFYEDDGVHLKIGDTRRVDADARKKGHDLPRGVAGKRTALIPDPRNDENLIVAQTHVAMIRLHNTVADSLPVDAIGQALRAGPQEGHAALPVADPARLPAAHRGPRTGRRRVHQRPQAGRARRRADRRTDDADRVLGGGVPARAQHDPRRLQLEPALPGPGREPGVHVRLLGAGRHPRRRPDPDQHLAGRLAPDVRLRRGRSSRARAGQQRQHGQADRHSPDRPAQAPAPEHLRRARTRWASTTDAATWPSAT